MSAASSPNFAAPAQALEVIEFWQEAGPRLWFAKDAAFDQRFRERFLSGHKAAVRGELATWETSADAALALVLLLYRFPRNAFRGTPRMYASDRLARGVADAAIGAGFDRTAPPELQVFFYLPFGHSEDLAGQERAVALCRRLGPPHLGHAQRHCEIVRRLGRFPHRNAILGRATTAEEQAYLDDGGYAG
jgi:uncharacterized protein (DUF924 family)